MEELIIRLRKDHEAGKPGKGRSAGKSSITSIKAFAGSTELFHDPVIVMADLDRGYQRATFRKKTKRNTIMCCLADPGAFLLCENYSFVSVWPSIWDCSFAAWSCASESS